MSQGYLLVPLTQECPITRAWVYNTNQILSTKGRIPPNIWWDPLTRLMSPAEPLARPHVQPIGYITTLIGIQESNREHESQIESNYMQITFKTKEDHRCVILILDQFNSS